MQKVNTTINTKEVFEFCRNNWDKLMVVDHPDTPKLGSVIIAGSGRVVILMADKKYCEMFVALVRLFKVIGEAGR